MAGDAGGDADVVVVGGGPVGLWLGAELRLGGVVPVVLERGPAPSPYSRGMAVHARTLEVFAMRGVVDEHLAEGRPIPALHFGMMTGQVSFSGLDSPYPYMLAIPQRRTEQLIEVHARALGADVRREHVATDVRDVGDHVDVEVEGPDGPYVLHAQHVVGCDGGGSLVRERAGIAFTGDVSTRTTFLADVQLADPPPHPISRHGEHGAFVCMPMPGDLWRMVSFDTDRMHVGRDVPVTLEEVRTSARRILGTDYGAHSPYWMARVGNAALQAEHYRRGRILLAGDAAHIHPPQGGQGLNLGVQDAMNLGWKLAAVLAGWAPDELLDSYHAERHPVGARVLQAAQAQNGLACPMTAEERAVRDLMAGMITELPSVNEALARRVSGLDVAYASATGDGDHRLTGRRVPDLALAGAPTPTLLPLLADGRFLLLTFAAATAAPPADGLDDRLAIVAAAQVHAPEPWATVTAVLVRPDGHVAWATDEPDPDRRADAVRAALHRWCGAATDVAPA
jgi:2-polyprenyl-6-methoxyphenol hydroxylase-like FAD-dependent oxidoreductase